VTEDDLSGTSSCRITMSDERYKHLEGDHEEVRMPDERPVEIGAVPQGPA
jgi:hypothetical protein